MFAIGPGTINLGESLRGTTFVEVVKYNVPQIIIASANLLFAGAGTGAFIFLLWGAIQWVLAGGDKEGLEKARKKITGALIGLALVFSVYAFGTVANILFNVNIFNICIPGIARGCGTLAPATPISGSEIICSATCKSNPDGSEKDCYPQLNPRTGNVDIVSCGPGGYTCRPGPCP